MLLSAVNRFFPVLLLILFFSNLQGQTAYDHPRIYVSNTDREAFMDRLNQSERTRSYVEDLKQHVEPYVTRHQSDPKWIISRLQMYWKTRYERVFVNGMDYSHGEGQAAVPTVRFSGSRDWATDYMVPALEDVKPYMDDERGIYLQNKAKDGQPWEWAPIAETGHVIEKINEEILDLAEDAAFLFWLTEEVRYAKFATDILMKYVEGMHHREPPLTVENHRNAKLMGLQTFEVIHERIIVPVTITYDFLYPYLKANGKDIAMINAVLKKWVEQEIKFGVPDNNWNLMQARYITYLALALEDDEQYEDRRGQQYYLDQMINQNSEKQKALVDVLKIFDQNTGIWPETAGYSTGVSEDILEVICLVDRVYNDKLLQSYPLVEKAILSSFQYLYPNGLTVAFGDAKHSTLRFNALELLVAQYRKYGELKKEAMITDQLKGFMDQRLYKREEVNSLFQLFFYVDELKEPAADTNIPNLTTPVFYAPNVSWLVQRNGTDPEQGMMISQNASLGNHSHTNGINIELYAQGLVFAPDGAAGESYWSEDHHEYYARFPAHNTVVVDGKSDYRSMKSDNAFTLEACFPNPNIQPSFSSPYTFSSVSFSEPSTNARQHRQTATVRTSESGGYFIDIFRSARLDGQDLKHEYLFHSQGAAIQLFDNEAKPIVTSPTNELSSTMGDLPGYDYFQEKQSTSFDQDFISQFTMSAPDNNVVQVNLWMRGFPQRKIFSVMAPPSRALNKAVTPETLYQKPLPTLVVRQEGEAQTRPFVSVIEAYGETDGSDIQQVRYFDAETKNPSFTGIAVHRQNNEQDYIFSDENGEQENHFEQHRFKGTYGLISYQDNQVKTAFLGSGRLLESAGWRIESTEKSNAVYIEINGDGIQAFAKQPFTLTLPLTDTKEEIASFNLIQSLTQQIFEGKIITKDGQHFAHFELPEMDNVILAFSE